MNQPPDPDEMYRLRERAAIMEFDAGMSRSQADIHALNDFNRSRVANTRKPVQKPPAALKPGKTR